MMNLNDLGKLLNGEDVGNDALQKAKQQRTFGTGPVGVLAEFGPFSVPKTEAKKEKSLADLVKEALGNPAPIDPKSFKPGSLADMVHKALYGPAKNFDEMDAMEASQAVMKMAEAMPEMVNAILGDDMIVDKSKALSSLASDFSKRCAEKMSSIKK